jgi:hypothetical protein
LKENLVDVPEEFKTKNLKEIFEKGHFLTEDYFLLRMTKDVGIIYRIFDGSEMCRINPA